MRPRTSISAFGAPTLATSASICAPHRHTRSGVIGRSRSWMPAAWFTAAPTAAAIARMPPSPAPFAPNGPGPSSFSIRIECSALGGVLNRRNTVVQRAEVANPPAIVEQQLLHEAVPEPHDRGAFVLRFDLLRVQRLADVAHQDQLDDLDHADLGVHLDLRRGAHHLPERRPPAQRMRGIVRVALMPDADDLSARRSEMRLQELLVAQSRGRI